MNRGTAHRTDRQPITRQTDLQGKCSAIPSARSSRALPRVSTEVAASIAQRATLLDLPDRLLLEQLYLHGWPATRVAKLTGESARVVRCRASRLVRRVLSPAFQVVTTRSGCWPHRLQRVGHNVFVRGRTLRATAKDLGLSYYQVAQLVTAIRAIAEAARAETRQSWKRGAA